MEEWKDVVGFEGFYQVSSTGQIRNYKTGKILVQRISKGYKAVGLHKLNKNKTCSVHRLVAMAFIPNPIHKREVNHIDGNKTNNNIENLEWVTPKENTQHAIKIGLWDKRQCEHEKNNRKRIKIKAIDVIKNKKTTFDSLLEASNRLNISRSCIQYVIKNKTLYKGTYAFELEK